LYYRDSMNGTDAGQRLIANRYAIEDVNRDLIGQGGMGSVYRGLDRETGDLVAIKLLRPDLVRHDPEQVARFVREGQLLRQLNHPNIVKMLASAVYEDDHYLIMEYVVGGSLRDLLNQEPQLAERRVLTIGLELADALARAHHLQIIHRDIKPANVLLAEDGTPRLTDFGLARGAGYSQLTQSGALAGTYAYLSPEVCRGEIPDGRADIWSFGVMLYEMLAGKNPFDQQQVAATLTAIIHNPPPDLRQFRPDVSEALLELINQMLVKNRDNRLGSARIVGAALESIRSGSQSSSSWSVNRPVSGVASGIGSVSGIASGAITPSGSPRHNLPSYAAPFLGREEELAAVAERLADPACRLLSILGPGGVGKSRLAIQAAYEQMRQFRDGVFWVSLTGLSSPALLIPTLAEATQFTFYQEKEDAPDLQKQFVNYLREKNILLVLDNFENVLDNSGIIAAILTACPQVKILVSSSERLNLREEWSLPLTGLPLPDQEQLAELGEAALDYEAVRLFAQCASRVTPNFSLTAENGPAVAEICHLVGGIPLGIELAAAWTQLLSPAEIVSEIRESFDFLQTEMVNVPERHRSLRATFEYSWARLTAVEKQALRRLSIFRKGFNRIAAGAVALEGSTAVQLSQLSALLNKSLLNRLTADRYQIHELLRQYAAQKLAEDADEKRSVAQRHAAYYAEFLAKQSAPLFGPEQKEAAEKIEVNIENIRAAWGWLTADETDADFIQTALLQARISLTTFYQRRSWHEEGAELWRQAADCLRRRATAASPALAYALLHQAAFLYHSGQPREGERLLAESAAIFRDLTLNEGLAETALWEARFAQRQGAYALALTKHEQSQTLFREQNNLVGLADSLADSGYIISEQGRYAEATALYEESLAIRRRLGDRLAIADALNGLAALAYRRGEATAVKALAEEGLAIYKELDHQPGVARITQRLAMAAGIAGDYHKAIGFYERSLAIYKRMGNQAGVANCLLNLTHNTNLLGDYEASQKYGLESAAILRRLQDRVTLMYASTTSATAALNWASMRKPTSSCAKRCLSPRRRTPFPSPWRC
jgi:serine/threonine protein kinase/predicted ATPase